MAMGVSEFSGDAGVGQSTGQEPWPGQGAADGTRSTAGPFSHGGDATGQSRQQSGNAGESPADGAGPAAGAPRCPVSAADSRLLKKSLAMLEPQSDRVMAYFFATFFVHKPELRP